MLDFDYGKYKEIEEGLDRRIAENKRAIEEVLLKFDDIEDCLNKWIKELENEKTEH